MADASETANPSERNKLIAAGALALVLVGVLVMQFSGSGEPAGGGRVTRPKRPEVSPAGAKSPLRGWPQSALADVLKANPFASLRKPEPKQEEEPEPEPDPEADKRQAEETSKAALSSLESKRVRAVIMTDNGPAALLGTTLVKVGDVVDGVKIVAIRHDGVIVEPAP